MSEADDYLAKAKSTLAYVESISKTSEREVLALAAIADALIALVELTSFVKARDAEVMGDDSAR